jgi:hypothetical protein
MRQGFYGLGESEPSARKLADQLAVLIEDKALRERLATFGRQCVEERFSLEQASQRLLTIYETAAVARPGYRWSETVRVCWRALMQEVHNHEPARKRRQRQREETLLSAAALGAWPPAELARP